MKTYQPLVRLSLAQIKRDSKLSPRKETDPNTAEAYAECFDQLPPIEVFKIPGETQYYLVDGWHRYRAAEILKLEEVEVQAFAGTMEQAREYALLANLRHGLPLTRKEKRHVIAEFLKLHPERSNSWIAGDLGTTTHTIINIRTELEESNNLVVYKVLIGRDGKERPRTIEQPKKEETTEEPETTAEDGDDEETEELEVEEPELPSIPMLGVYELDKVHQADCLIGLMGLPENSIDLVFADPPYNLGKDYGGEFKDRKERDEYFKWCFDWFKEVQRVLRDGGAFYLMHYPEVAAQWKWQLDGLFGLFTFQRWLSWVYPSNIGHGKDNWRRSHRTILYYVKGDGAAFFDGEADPQPYKNPDDIRVAHLGKRGTTPYDWWEYDLVKNVSKDKKAWPNQLPVSLVERIVLSSCPPGGIVCDPFMGSGTTASAAIRSERSWIGFDTQVEACRITMERVRE